MITGDGRNNLNMKDFNKLYIPTPCLEEQTKTADFLSTFDRKIDNQKAQLEHWQQIKKDYYNKCLYSPTAQILFFCE